MKTTKQLREQKRLDTVTVWSSVVITIIMVAYLVFTQ